MYARGRTFGFELRVERMFSDASFAGGQGACATSWQHFKVGDVNAVVMIGLQSKRLCGHLGHGGHGGYMEHAG